MTYPTLDRAHLTLHNDRVRDEDAERQTRATEEILCRLRHQPGVILADEVGMGKTFIALAVSMSVLLQRPNDGPVVVMSPPSLRHKWPKDWKVFLDKCVKTDAREQFRAATADSGVEFLRLLDDPPDRRKHVIFLTHGALNRSMGDGFVKLAVLRRAFKGRSSLAGQRRVFGRWAGRILRMEGVERRAKGSLLGTLFEAPYESWRRIIHRADERFQDEFPDDPVPQHLADVLEDMGRQEFDTLVEALKGLPLRESASIDERLATIRRELAAELEAVWQKAFRQAQFRSPLLVLDEAHHAKNPRTRLSSLFMTEESAADAGFVSAGGPLAGKFERMLFLTATPFQLGHAELIRVLERFEGIDWEGPRAPSISRVEFGRQLRGLAGLLDDAQSAALRLDRAWSRVTHEHIGVDLAAPEDVERWWETARAAEGEGIVAQIAVQVQRTREVMQKAEAALTPWVLRHVRPDHLPGENGIPRREVLTGAAIRDEGNGHEGLEITPDVLLPFLLAGRAQGLLAASTRGRALFAEGLASSFEAYLETRRGTIEVEEDGDMGAVEAPPELEWYLKQLDNALPRNDREIRSAHPKIRATAERAIALWRAGEKVLIFCHYRATGRALRQHISALLHEEIIALGAARLPGRSPAEVQEVLDSIGDRFFDDERLRAQVVAWVGTIVERFAFDEGEQKQVIDVIRRFLRTPSFLVRYFPIDAPDVSTVVVDALEARHGHQSLRERIEGFCRFLAERCISDERAEFLAALETVQTGTHFGKEVRALFDAAEGGSAEEGAALLPNVRLANGEVRSETRRRLLLTFNTPLFPEILVASSVLAEGVDLHLHCRHVIHHDLCWNPSTLEQRSGRVDRIGCRAEQVGAPIHLYLPYVAATQDEKMFRVVRDRERWFQIVMGETYEVDEAATDRRAERVPLPETVQRQLSMRLHP